MQRDGFAFLDIIVGIFVIGLIIVVIFPALGLTQKYFANHKNTAQMSYLAESTIEKLILKDGEAISFLQELEACEELIYPYLEDENYISTVRITNENEYFWNISVRVKESKGGEAYVELEAAITK